jgi:hypothetical protein
MINRRTAAKILYNNYGSLFISLALGCGCAPQTYGPYNGYPYAGYAPPTGPVPIVPSPNAVGAPLPAGAVPASGTAGAVPNYPALPPGYTYPQGYPQPGTYYGPPTTGAPAPLYGR